MVPSCLDTQNAPLYTARFGMFHDFIRLPPSGKPVQQRLQRFRRGLVGDHGFVSENCGVLLVEGWRKALIQDADGNFRAVFQRAQQRSLQVSGIVLRFQLVGMLLVIREGIDLVEADAGLEDIHQRIALVEDRSLHDFGHMLLIAAERARRKRCPGRQRNQQRVHGPV